jgi:hypothetical protein
MFAAEDLAARRRASVKLALGLGTIVVLIFVGTLLYRW